MHKELVNCLVNLAQERSVVRLTERLDKTIAVSIDWDVKHQTKRKQFLANNSESDSKTIV